MLLGVGQWSTTCCWGWGGGGAGFPKTGEKIHNNNYADFSESSPAREGKIVRDP